jgi:general secretion pathway protein F
VAYVVRCLDAAGHLVEQTVEAGSLDDARRLAQQPGWAVLGVRAGTGSNLRRRESLDAVAIARDIAALLRAGISLVETIGIMAERQPKETLRNRLGAVHDRLAQGQRLSASLEADPGLLPLFFAASVRAAETTGQLPEALERFVVYQSRVDALRGRLAQSLLYPAVVVAVGVLVVLFLMLYVVPRFAGVFADLRVDLPWGSRMLLATGSFVDAHGGLILGLLIFAATLMVMAAASHRARAALQRRVLALPGVRGPHRVYRLAIFYRNLGMLLQGGVPLPAALTMAAPTLGGALDARALAARDALLKGVSPAAALDAEGLTTVESRRMLQVGERSGRLPEMLESVADFHDAEVARSLERFGRLFEPLVMVGLGLIIGTVVVLLYMPIFDLAGAVG